MRVSATGVINSNLRHFCSPEAMVSPRVSRINPGKSTFLNSNLLLSNILNHLPSSPTPHRNKHDQPDAYEQRQIQKQLHSQQQAEQKERAARVRKLAKARSQATLEQHHLSQEQLRQQVEAIGAMRMEAGERARDILTRKEDTAYLGRHLFQQGEKFLKNMQAQLPAQRLCRLEATRLLMKDRAKTKGRAQRHSTDADEADLSQSLAELNESSLQASVDAYERRVEARAKGQHQDHLLAQMVRNGNFQHVLQAQKRLACSRAFAEHWAAGFRKNEDLICTRKHKKGRKGPERTAEPGTHSGLDYNDKAGRHQALKAYKEAFDRTAASYSLQHI